MRNINAARVAGAELPGHTSEQTVNKLNEAEVLLSWGTTVLEL